MEPKTLTSKIEHYRKLMTNPQWRLNNLYRIVDKQSNVITFRENPIQAILNRSNSRYKQILKARQFGITTNEVIKMFDNTIFTKNVTNCILAHENDAVKKIFRIVKRAYRFLHPEFKPKPDRGGGSKYEMYFPDLNSLIYCDLESRGDTINWLHCSEAAFMDLDRFISTSQAVPLNGKITLESTANGIGNFFYETWTDKGNSFEKHFYPWYMHDEYKIDQKIKDLSQDELGLIESCKKKYKITISTEQIAYRRQKKKELKEKFVQEYPEDDNTCFLMSGQNVCDLEFVSRKLKELSEPISEKDGLQIFEHAKNGVNYIIGADTAQGINGDYCTASVIRADTRTEAAFYRGKIKPIRFAHKLADIGKLYSKGHRKPLLGVEKNNHGHAVLQELTEHIQYANVYYYKKGEPGWLTTTLTRPIMVNDGIEAIESEFVQIKSKETFREMLTLVNINGKIQAASGKHDDCVMATFIAIQLLMETVNKIRDYSDIKGAILV
jgi:hypothetical protein